MKKIVFILFLVFKIIFVNGQITYSKMFDLYTEWESFKYVNSVGNNICLSGTSINFFVKDSTKYRKIFIVKIDTNLTIINKNEIQENYLSASSLFPINGLKNNYIYGVIDTNNIIKHYLINSDSSLVISNKRSVSYNSKLDLTCNSFLNNKIYLFGFDYTNNVASKVKLSIQCVDSNGNLLWGKVFQDKRCYTNNVVQTKDGNFLLAGFKYFGESTGSDDSSFAWYAKVDTLGNILWEHLLDRKSSLLTVVAWLTKTNDRCFLSGCNIANYGYFDDVFGDTSFCYIAEIDENNGNILWKKRFLTVVNSISGLDSRMGAMTYHNGYLYALIEHKISERENPGDYTQYVMFAKFDLQGNIIWKRLFSNWYLSNRAYSLTPIDDGFLICGDSKDSTHAKGDSDAWLIKTDTNGCIIPGCNAKDGIVQIINPEKVFTVYPNPAQNEI
ncbi:MAG: hypothetical protein ACOYMA_13960, partial [Bacteroidia bacterium]